MPVVLFAILGANTNTGVLYWICFAVYCVLYVLSNIKSAADKALW